MRDLTVWGWRALLLSVILATVVGLPNLESNFNSWQLDNPDLNYQDNSSAEQDTFTSDLGGSDGGEVGDDSESSSANSNDPDAQNSSAGGDDTSTNSGNEVQADDEEPTQTGDEEPAQTDESTSQTGSPSSEPELTSSESNSRDSDSGSSKSSDLPDGAMSGDWVVPATRVVILSIAAVFAVGAIGSMLGAALVSEGVRMGLLLAVAGPIVGFMVKNENGTFTRGRVLGYIEAHPGIHFSALRDALDLANGVTAHHLYSLEKEGKVISWADARRRRYATSGIDPKRLKEIENPLTGMQQAIMQVLVESGGMGLTSIELRQVTQTSRQLMSYHLRCLDEKDLVITEGKGRKKTWKIKSSGRTSLLATSHL